MNVRTFIGKKYVPIARDNFTISTINDIGEATIEDKNHNLWH